MGSDKDEGADGLFSTKEKAVQALIFEGIDPDKVISTPGQQAPRDGYTLLESHRHFILVLDPETEMLQYKSEDLSNCFWSTWLSRFPTITKDIKRAPMMPITVGNLSNIVLAGDENGNIYLWKDVESIKENIGSNLATHTSNV